MRIKKKTGITAMVDAMIFIVVLGIAVTAMHNYSNSEPLVDDASFISEKIFSGKLRMCDMIETEDTGVIGIPDLVAYYLLTDNDSVAEYLDSVLRTLTQRPDSYLLVMDYDGHTSTIGYDRGDPVSSCTVDYTVTYGGSVRIELSLF